MLFKLPFRVYPQDRKPYFTYDRESLAADTVVQQPMRKFPRLGITIRGDFETSERSLVIGLMKSGGNLQFNPMDAVREEILTRAEVKSLGFRIPGDEEVKPVKVEDPAPVADPLDMDTATKARLVEWALNQKPPINLDPRKRKDHLKADLLAELSARNNQKADKEK